MPTSPKDAAKSRAALDFFRYAMEKGYAVVFDVSGETNNLVYYNPGADITTDVITRVDEETAKRPPAAA